MTAFGLDRDGQDGIRELCWVRLENTPEEWWAVYRQASSCATAKICPPLGCFPKQHLISLWFIAFNWIFYYSFYSGVSESRVWPVASELLPSQTEMVKERVQKQTQSRVASTSVIPNPTGFSFSRVPHPCPHHRTGSACVKMKSLGPYSCSSFFSYWLFHYPEPRILSW